MSTPSLVICLFAHGTTFTGRGGDSDTCPPIPDGYFPVSAAQTAQNIKDGEATALKYSEQESLARRSNNLTTRALPDKYDPRTTNKLVRKSQIGSGLCGTSVLHAFKMQLTGIKGSFTFTSVVEGAYYQRFKQISPELSPLWVAMCAVKQDSYRNGRVSSPRPVLTC